MNSVNDEKKNFTIIANSKKNLHFNCISCRKYFSVLMCFKRHAAKSSRPNGCSNKDNLTWELCMQNANKQIKYYKQPKQKKKHGICMYNGPLTDNDVLDAKKNCSLSMKDIMVGLDGCGREQLSRDNAIVLELFLKKYKKLGYNLEMVEHTELYTIYFGDESTSNLVYRHFYYLIKDNNIYVLWRNTDGKMIKVGKKSPIIINEDYAANEDLYKYEINRIHLQTSFAFYGRDATYYSSTWRDGNFRQNKIMQNERTRGEYN